MVTISDRLGTDAMFIQIVTINQTSKTVSVSYNVVMAETFQEDEHLYIGHLLGNEEGRIRN